MQRSAPAPKTHTLYWLALALILGLAASLRLWQLDASSLWSDEGNTWALVQRSFAQIAVDAAADIHPPGYYWLLKAWATLFGTSAAALRAFSVLCGVLLVGVIERIGHEVAPGHTARAWMPLLAALLAALNPFQIYYSQEARMYMLLALESALLMWALLVLLRLESQRDAATRRTWGAATLYVLAACAGLWTHYSFPIVLLAAGLAWLVWWLRNGMPRAALLRFAAANAIVLLLFAPWLQIAVRQLSTWPQGGESMAWRAGILLTLRTLLLGLMHDFPAPTWLWLGAAALLPLLGLLALRAQRGVATLALWLLLPIGMMAALGLFSDAFLKFLLIASAPWCLLVAASSESGGTRGAPVLRALVALGAMIFALLALPPYYGDALARDNYAGVARYLAAAGNPQTELVLLNAPGQADVWGYYDPGIPMLTLPTTRPVDAAATVSALETATAGKDTIYALLWATDESDPDSSVTNWLDANLFKGQEVWQNNMRFTQYYRAQASTCTQQNVGNALLTLLRVCTQGETTQPVAAGKPYVIQLEWRAEAAIERAYKVSVQILDARQQVLAQNDSEPSGGAQPTTSWQPGELIVDRHAVLIPYGTPPGAKTVAISVYDALTGERLLFGETDHIPLSVVVETPALAIPVELLPMQHVAQTALDDLTLLGYSQHKKGFGHAPETPILPGDLVHLTLFWQAPAPLPAAWHADQQVTLQLGDVTRTAPLAGGSYPTAAWPAGALVRAEFDMPWDGQGARRIRVGVENDSLLLAPFP